MPEPNVMQGSQSLDNKFVIINRTLTGGQMHSVAQTFHMHKFDFDIEQIYLVNNQLPASEFAFLLKSLSKEQVREV